MDTIVKRYERCSTLPDGLPGTRIKFITGQQGHRGSEPRRPKLRFRLEDPRTGQQQVFASPEALVATLRQKMVDGDESRDRQGGQ